MAKTSLFGKRTKETTELPQKPDWWMGSLPEWLIYWALLKLGLKDQFTYQSSRMGGRMVKGGAILDFYFADLRLAINVQSIYYHYVTAARRMADALQRAQLEGMGIKVIYIMESAALSNPLFYVKEALRGIDHSSAH